MIQSLSRVAVCISVEINEDWVAGKWVSFLTAGGGERTKKKGQLQKWQFSALPKNWLLPMDLRFLLNCCMLV
jgi:hypothetical protein